MRRLFLAILLSACGSGPTPGVCSTSADCASTDICIDGTCEPRASLDASMRDDARSDVAAPPAVVSIAITPADPSVTSDGTPQSVDFQLQASWSDGSTSTLGTVFWSAASSRLGDIDSTTGVFTVDGDIGGVETIQADALGMSATTTLTVSLTRSVLGPGVPADAASRFGAPTDDAPRAANLLYPLDGTLFPQNVYPPDVQWERGADGDLYRVTLSAPHVDAHRLRAPLGRGLRLRLGDRPRRVARAGRFERGREHEHRGRPLDRRHERDDRGHAAQLRLRHRLDHRRDLLLGPPSGRILRIGGDGSGLESFLPNPPPRASDGERCVACHTVSRDGRRMAAEIWDASRGFGAVFDLTADLTADPAPTLVPPTTTRWLTSSFNPDATRLIANWANEIFLVDATTGRALDAERHAASDDGLGATRVVARRQFDRVRHQPQRRQLGRRLHGERSRDHPRHRAGHLRRIDACSWPAAEARSPARRGRPTRLDRHPERREQPLEQRRHAVPRRNPPRGDGWLGRSTSPRSTEARRTATTRRSRPSTPAATSGSRSSAARDYGNAQVGTRGTGRRQLWVSAVSNAPSAGSDPSRVPYWIPQQDVTHQNMAAFWAEEACRADGRECAASGECCSGFCRDVGAGPVCVPPDVPTCSMRGEACRDDGDCCAGEGSCVSNICSVLG